MQIRLERESAAVVVTARGEIDAYLAPQLEDAFSQASGDAKLVVDLSRVSFMDSTALGVVARGVRARGTQEHDTRVILPRSSARRIFEITTLDRVLPVSSSREDALSALAASDRQP